MTSNPSITWGSHIVEALATNGVETFVIAPGSRSTPIVVAAHEHERTDTYSIIDERSAGFFAVGRAKRTGEPAAVVTTSGTAGANVYPAVIEADHSRTPLIVCTADRPEELQESGTNQTIEQRNLFGEAIRWTPTIPHASASQLAVDALRATVASAVNRSVHPYPGPVHLNVPFRKPLGPNEQDTQWEPPRSTTSPPAMALHRGSLTPSPSSIEMLRAEIDTAARPLIVAGPLPIGLADDVRTLASAIDIPILADALSGVRFGPQDEAIILGGYDAFLDPSITTEWPASDLIIRFGARPTSVQLQRYLRTHAGEHILVDPVGAYRDPSFSTTAVVPADISTLVDGLLDSINNGGKEAGWNRRFVEIEQRYWEFVESHQDRLPPESRVAHHLFSECSDDTTVFVSNSMPIRDVDRFARPTEESVTVLANRGASGIDGITSTALGAGSGTTDDLVLLTGDLAWYHDMNGLLAIERCNVNATIVVINNEGGGIFQMLPIAEVDPPFTEHFRTPHGLDFEAVAGLYDLPYQSVTAEAFSTTALQSNESRVIEIPVNGERNHRMRRAFQDQFADAL